AQPVRARVITPRAPGIVDGNWLGRGSRSRDRSYDEFDQRRPGGEGDEPVYQVDADMPRRGGAAVRSGDRVSHDLHGQGRVVAVSGEGKDTKVVVDFPAAGRKTIIAKFLRAADDSLN